MSTAKTALTGGIASGKSVVAGLFADLGARIVDSDVLAREVVAPGTAGLAAIRARFGPQVIGADGSLDRAALAAIIYADEQARQDLNAIVHPAVLARRAELSDSAPAGSVVIAVIPLLVETGLVREFDRIIVVDLPEELQLARLMARNGLTERQARDRVRAQASRAERLAVADWAIDNSGSPDRLGRQVMAVWAALGGPDQLAD